MREEPSDTLPLKKLPPPGVLWHYTTIDVVEYFLRGEVAFSHYKFLNDNAELQHGKDLLCRIAVKTKNEGLKRLTDSDWFDQFEDAYLFCLSRFGDNLYQWRSYTPHGGVAIGFNRRDLLKAIYDGAAIAVKSADIKPPCRLLTCRYDDVFAEKVVARLSARKSGQCLCNGVACKNFGLYLAKMQRIVLAQKNPSFEEEHEERFLIMGKLRKQVQVVKGKPCIIVSNPEIGRAITCVRLSPHGDRKRNKLLVEMLKDKHDLTFNIEESSSSYNGR